MNKRLGVVMMLSLGSLVGCTSIQRTPFPTFNNLAPAATEEKTQTNSVSEEELLEFFNHYFSLSEEEVLLLNVQPEVGDESYEEDLRVYREKLKNLLGNQLADEAKAKLKLDYRTYDFHLPKKLALNGYVTYGATKVEKVEIVATRLVEEDIVYKVALTTLRQVEDLEEANKTYRWDEKKRYYVNTTQEGRNEKTFNPTEEDIDGLEESFYYLQETPEDTSDSIKLLEYYWVTVEPSETLKVKSVKEGTPINVNENMRQVAMNTKHVERLPYYEEASASESQVLQKVFTTVFSQPREFYTYYNNLILTDEAALRDCWLNKLGLEKVLLIPVANGQNAYSGAINPYKENLEKVELKAEAMTLKPSVYSTKKQPRFQVMLPVKAKDMSGKELYYQYAYYVGMEQGKVEFIYYVNRTTLSPEAYGSMIGEETPVPTESPAAMATEANLTVSPQ